MHRIVLPADPGRHYSRTSAKRPQSTTGCDWYLGSVGSLHCMNAEPRLVRTILTWEQR